MLNTYIRDIYCNTYLHPENALRVPNLMEKLIGDTEKCKATMQAILESYIKERRKQHKATRAFEILTIGNN